METPLRGSRTIKPLGCTSFEAGGSCHCWIGMMFRLSPSLTCGSHGIEEILTSFADKSSSCLIIVWQAVLQMVIASHQQPGSGFVCVFDCAHVLGHAWACAFPSIHIRSVKGTKCYCLCVCLIVHRCMHVGVCYRSVHVSHYISTSQQLPHVALIAFHHTIDRIVIRWTAVFRQKWERTCSRRAMCPMR
jgi:hypothetical protein